jgi:hypothetical protein
MPFASQEASSVTYPIFQRRIQGEGRRLIQKHLEQVIGNSSSVLQESIHTYQQHKNFIITAHKF